MTRRVLTALMGFSLLAGGVMLSQQACAAPSAQPRWRAACCCQPSPASADSCRTTCELQAADRPAAAPAFMAPAGAAVHPLAFEAFWTVAAPAPAGPVLARSASAAPPHVPLKRYLLTHTFRL